MRVLIRFSLFGVLAIALMPAIGRAQPSDAYELSCPAGYDPMPAYGKTFNSQTGKWRANVCISNSGSGTVVCQMNGCGAGGVTVTTVAGLATVPGKTKGTVAAVTDGTSATDCTVGGGSTQTFCQYNGTTWGPISATSSFAGITSGLNIQPSLMQVGNGSQLIPNAFGQVANNSTWGIETDPSPSTGPTWVTSATGGSLSSAGIYGVEVTLNSAAGETTPSAEIQHQMPSCPGNTCSAIVTAPTVPSTFTGYTVYARVSTGSMQQIPGCVNITTNCTVTAIPTTSAPPTVNPVMPLPAGAAASNCPPNVTPFWWIQDLNGTPQSQAYITNTTANGWNGGIIVECRPHWWNDAGGTSGSWGDPPGGNNAMIVMDHLAGMGTNPTNQDRALWIGLQNPHTDTATRHGLEAIQAELDLYGNPNINGSPDGEVTVASLQLSDQTTALLPSIQLGTNLIRAEYDRQNTGGAVPQVNGAYLRFDNFSNTAQPQQISGTKVLFINGGSGGGSQQNIMHNMQFPSPRFGTSNVGLYGGTPGSFTAVLGTDWFIRNDIANFPSALNGPLWIPSLNNSSMSTLGVVGPISISGSVQTVQANAPPAPSVVCSGGASTYTYQLVGVDANGGTIAGSTNTCNTGTNPLASGTPATISINANTYANQLILEQFKQVDVYRTGGPMATGKIGTLTCFGGVPGTNTTCSAFSDTGLTPTGSVPAVNSTGSIQTAYGYKNTNTCTSSASPAVCGNTTAGFVAIAAGGTTLTINTTAVTASSIILAQPDQSLGTALGVTCNTALNNINVSARVPGTSFTVVTNTPVTNPECMSFLLIN